MSGQPYRYASDKERFRAEYMANLNLRAELDNTTLQAVKTYVSNGSLPAVSQMQDTRTTAEKLMDLNGLKQNIIKDFASIMDANIAESLIQGILQSPLNIDNRLLVFIAQRAPEIVQQLTKLYKYKIKGDSNDIFTFVEFINNMYATKNNSTASMKSFMNRVYDKSSGMANTNDLEIFVQDLRNMFSLLASKSQFGKDELTPNPMTTYNEGIAGNIRPLKVGQYGFAHIDHSMILENIQEKVNRLIYYLPNDVQLEGLKRAIVENQFLSIQAQPDIYRFIEFLEWMTQSMPNKEFLKSLSNSVKSIIDDSRRTGKSLDNNLISTNLERIWELIPIVPQNLEALDFATFGNLPPDPRLNRGNVPPVQPVYEEEYDIPQPKRTADDVPEPEPRQSEPQQPLLRQGKQNVKEPEYYENDLEDYMGGINSNLPVRQSKDSGGSRGSLSQLNPNEGLYPAIPESKSIRSQSESTLQPKKGILKSPIEVSNEPLDKSHKISGAEINYWSNAINDLTKTMDENNKKIISNRDPSKKDDFENERLRLIEISYDYVNLMSEDGFRRDEIEAIFEKSAKSIKTTPVSVKKQPKHEVISNKKGIAITEYNDAWVDLYTNIAKNNKDKASEGWEDRSDKLNKIGGQIIAAMKKDGFESDEIKNYRENIKANLKGTVGGDGLPKRRRGRPKGSGIKIPVEDNIDRSQGIEQSLKFSPFGKYLIHNGKLRDNVISLKNIKGGNVIGLPSNKVSSHFGKVMKTIIGGGLPSFNDMNGLSEEEKKYLYLISSKANIVDKLNIPTPSKDQEEKDLHLFEVYKGEVMAGNDSKELIQKFKALLLKLSKNGSLPKQQVNEILNEILQLGY